MEKINIAELLKDCPKGMELDCTMYDGVTLKEVNINDDSYPIQIETKSGFYTILTKYGQNIIMDEAKCVIFPKGKTTWDGFKRPFKDGDVVATLNGNQIFIFKEDVVNEGNWFNGVCYFGCDLRDNRLFKKGSRSFSRHATEEEKQKLFDAIKANGYKWNPKTKTLDKLIVPKFKVGDKIRHKTHTRQENAVTEIKDTHYILGDELALPFTSQDEYELVPNKFDITTLKPFDKVLVRDTDNEKWKPAFWGFYDIDHEPNYPYECCGNVFAQCIPYESNEHLLGTTKDCDEHYKTWE